MYERRRAGRSPDQHSSGGDRHRHQGLWFSGKHPPLGGNAYRGAFYLGAVLCDDPQRLRAVFKLHLYVAIAPIPLASFAGEPSQSIGRSFLKSYAAVYLEGAVIVLTYAIFDLFAGSAPNVNASAAAVSTVWSYIGELVFNMLILVGTVKMADRVVREMMGL